MNIKQSKAKDKTNKNHTMRKTTLTKNHIKSSLSNGKVKKTRANC